MEDLEKANQLTARKSDFSLWYQQILQAAEIIDKRYDVKGCFVWLPYGYRIMMNIKKDWDILFQDAGIKEMYFPLLVPKSYAQINDSWFEGFKKEAFWVTDFESKKAEYILRPTGEPAMYPMFKLWIRSTSDLPLRIYETVSSFRYETKHTRPIIRDREITVWHEIHTAHSTKEEAEEEARLHIKLWDKIWEKIAIVPLKVNKPKWECFPGAIGAVEYYNIMPTGKAMENGSINNLGQAYSKKFDIKFKDNDKEEFVWMICTGNGARYLAAIIGVHGDDKGLIIPPEVAPIQVIIIPIYKKDNKNLVMKKTKELYEKIKKENIRVEIDLKEGSVGSKFYDWELKGVPLRIEIGERDIKNKSSILVRRDTSKKEMVNNTKLIKRIKESLKDVQNSLLKNSEKIIKEKLINIDRFDDIKKELNNGKIPKVSWCGSGECWDKIKSIEEGIELFGTDLNKSKGKCIVCNKDSDEVGYISNTY